MICLGCGRTIPTTVVFCAYCGARIGEPSSGTPARGRPRFRLPTWGRVMLVIAIALALVLTTSPAGELLLNLFVDWSPQVHPTPGMPEQIVRPSVPVELAFVEEQSGFAAYVHTAEDLDISRAEEIYGEVTEVFSHGIMGFTQVFSGEISTKADDFVTGRVVLPYELDGRFVRLWDKTPGIERIRHVSVFIHRSGWIVAYYPRGQHAAQNVVLKGDASLSWDITAPLMYGINEAYSALGLDSDSYQVRFYDFGRPDETRLTLMVYGYRQKGVSHFSFSIPVEVSVTSGSWFHAAFNTNSSMAVSGDSISTVRGIGVGRPVPVARGSLKGKHTRPGDHSVSLTVDEEDWVYRSHRAFGVVALYHRGDGVVTGNGSYGKTVRLDRP